MNQDLEKIRHYQGTVGDFKNFFDQKAAETAKKDEENTNAYGTPEYQGFNDVHPTRGANASPHWKESVNLEEKKNENPFKVGDKVIVTSVGGPDAKRFNGKKGTVIGTQSNYVSVNLKGFRSPDIEFATHELKLDESVNEAKEVEVTQEMWDKEWKIRKTFGKEYEEHFAKRIEAAMSKAKNEEMAENWAFINWKQLPGKADGMTIKESVNEEYPDHTSGLTIKGRGFDWKKSKDTKFKKGQDVIVQDVHDPRYKKYNGKKGQITDILKWSEGSPSYHVRIRGKEIEFNGFELKLDESNSTSTKADRLPLFEDFQG